VTYQNDWILAKLAMFILVSLMSSVISPISLNDRFPHLRKEIQFLERRDAGFRQLREDYELLLRSLEVTKPGDEGDREEMIRLKTSLEAEALEMLSQVSVRR
jgi:hypothetical protein